jgi:hypothetical protein
MQLLLITRQFNQTLLFHYVVLKLTWKGEILLDGPESSVFPSFYFPLWRFDPTPGHGLPLRGFAITLTGHTTLGRTPLNERSARRRDLYLTTHTTLTTDIHAPGGIQTHNPSKQAVSLSLLSKNTNTNTNIYTGWAKSRYTVTIYYILYTYFGPTLYI